MSRRSSVHPATAWATRVVLGATRMPAWAAFALAIALSLLSIQARRALDPVLGPAVPFLFYFPIIMVAGWLGGFWPGSLATAITAVGAARYHLPLFRGSGRSTELVALAVFVGVGLVLSALNQAWRQGIVLRERERSRFELALEASPAAMILCDRAGNILYASALAEQLTGYSRPELLGRAIDELVPRRSSSRHASHRADFFADPRQRPMGPGRELHLLRRDGAEIPVEIGLSPIEAPGGPLVIAVINDITARRQVEQARAALVESERVVAQEKDRFLAQLSHELRNTLAPLRSSASVLATLATAPAAGEAYRIFQRQIHNLVQLIDDLADLGRSQRRQIELRRERVALSKLVDSAVEASRPRIEERRHQLTVVQENGALWVDGDPFRLGQVLTNLLVNAAKYTPIGGNIRLETERQDDRAVVKLRDDGMGFAPETASRLFDLFYRDPRAADAADGLGIGLALARQLVELHGGTLTAHSDGIGLGSEFRVCLPLARPSGGTPEGESAAGTATA